MLSDSEHSSYRDEQEDDYQLTINEHFARAYEYRKEREELQKLEEKYGPNASVGDEDEDEDESDSESDESEDEDGEELTPAVDAAILRTLARIKKRDPGIYEAGRDVFIEEHQKSGKLSRPASKPKEKASKPVTLPAHRMATLLASSRSVSPESPDQPLTHSEEQSRLRAETIAAFHADVSTVKEEEAEGGLFTLREKTKDEIAQEEEEYRKYLEREVGDLRGLVEIDAVEEGAVEEPEEADGAEEKKKKKKKKKVKAEEGGKKGKEKEEQDQEFLLNYILNRGWIDKSTRRVPTYGEVTSGHKSGGNDEDVKAEKTDFDGELVDDEDFEEVVDRFESSYNHRFEEPDAATIPSFPRGLDTVRRPAAHTERRKGARERRKERKREEIRIKQEEVKRMKALKMREMKGKLDMVGQEGGWGAVKALEGLDLEGDWDPNAYDKQMTAILQEAEAVAVDDEKPSWNDDVDIGDIEIPEDDVLEASGSLDRKEKKKEKKKKEKAKKKGSGIEEDGVDMAEMDAEVEANGDWDEENWDGTEEMRKKVLDKYMDELYGLEFNDMVAGAPTRFKYVPVAKSSYALTPAEILMASDKDLNEYMGIKKYAPYRKEKETWDSRRGERLKEFKQKVTPQVSEFVGDSGLSTERKPKRRRGKKERMKEKEAQGGEEVVPDDGVQATGQENRRREKVDQKALRPEADAEEASDEEPARKKRRRHKKSIKAEGDLE